MNVLCVMAHPDDEVLGCGGTLAKHAENGDKVRVVILGRDNLTDDAGRAAQTLGAEVIVGRFPDQRFESVPFVDLVEAASSADGDVIYTHHPGDLNLDHSLTARAVLTAFRPKPDQKPRTILACEVISSTEWTFPQQFSPNWFESLSESQFEKKIQAMGCYKSELCDRPHPRSFWGIRNALVSRGQQCGVDYAEAFQLLRRGPC